MYLPFLIKGVQYLTVSPKKNNCLSLSLLSRKYTEGLERFDAATVPQRVICQKYTCVIHILSKIPVRNLEHAEVAKVTC